MCLLNQKVLAYTTTEHQVGCVCKLIEGQHYSILSLFLFKRREVTWYGLSNHILIIHFLYIILFMIVNL
jgi:hypothetical protein